jgi:hypothetical protein
MHVISNFLLIVKVIDENNPPDSQAVASRIKDAKMKTKFSG